MVTDDGERPARLLTELRESETRYRAPVLASSQMIWRTSPDGSVVENTEAWERATGQPLEQSSGWGWVDVVHPDDRDAAVAHWRRCLREGTPFEREYRILVDGVWRWLLARAVPVRGDKGAIREWIGTSIDVDEAHRSAERAELLLRLTADLAATRSAREVADVVRGHLRDSLAARTGGLYVPDRDGRLRLAAHFGHGAEVIESFAVVDPASSLPVARAFATGEPVFLRDPEARAGDAQVAGLLERTGNTAIAAMPLVSGNRPIGVVSAGFGDAVDFTTTVHHLLVALARQAGQALERAQVVGRLRGVASDLQQGLAPGDVPDVPGYELAAVYRAGGDAVELVGGDWYDVLTLPGGRVALVVGDVMGRGVHAATTMSAVSGAIRAYALLDPEPAVVLARLDAFVATHAPSQFVTLFYGLLDTATGAVRYLLAGHLPPLVLEAAGPRAEDAAPAPRWAWPAGGPSGTSRSPPGTGWSS